MYVDIKPSNEIQCRRDSEIKHQLIQIFHLYRINFCILCVRVYDELRCQRHCLFVIHLQSFNALHCSRNTYRKCVRSHSMHKYAVLLLFGRCVSFNLHFNFNSFSYLYGFSCSFVPFDWNIQKTSNGNAIQCNTSKEFEVQLI